MFLEVRVDLWAESIEMIRYPGLNTYYMKAFIGFFMRKSFGIPLEHSYLMTHLRKVFGHFYYGFVDSPRGGYL